MRAAAATAIVRLIVNNGLVADCARLSVPRQGITRLGDLLSVELSQPLVPVRLTAHSTEHSHRQSDDYIKPVRGFFLRNPPAAACFQRNAAGDRQAHIGVGINDQIAPP